jgi:pimeloyl-ACP methyl ester carboxylesterase
MKRPFLTRSPVLLFTALLIALSFPGCYPATKIPIDTLRYGIGETKGPGLLVVFLHGNGDRNSVFNDEGFVDAVREHGLTCDVISVDAHIGYYVNGTILTRLKEDVIDPARTKGYQHIWLVGNSLGGFGALSYAQKYPDEITGVVLLGPFLGERPVISEIRHAGGLLKWEPGDIVLKTKEDTEKHIWIWFKEHGLPGPRQRGDKNRPKGPGDVPEIYLGYGTKDRFTYAQDYLASLLPAGQVISIDGGHDWPTWKTLWNRFLDMGIFGK